mgnify:FL=1
MLPLSTHANVSGVQGVEVLKVLTLDEARSCNYEPSKCLIWIGALDGEALNIINKGWRGVF